MDNVTTKVNLIVKSPFNNICQTDPWFYVINISNSRIHALKH